MNIEIQKPELVERVNANIRNGRFQSADELIERALDALAASEALGAGEPPLRDRRSGAELVAALQASPHRALDIEPPRICVTMPVRDVAL